MLEGLRALIALESTGTLSEAAVRLRITQSAVSKRMQALETTLGYKVVEPEGRRLKLTTEGLLLLAKARPLLIELESLRDLGHEEHSTRTMAIGIADSIASSWGPRLIKKSLKNAKALNLELHVHRSTMVLEQIRLGRYELGLVAGGVQGADLVWDLLVEEPMVLVGPSAASKKARPILSIEINSATWREIGSVVLEHERLKGKKMIFLESFSAAVQMAREGFGQALVPSGLVKTMGLRSSEVITLSPRIKRSIFLVSRKSVATTKGVQELCKAMQALAATVI